MGKDRVAGIDVGASELAVAIEGGSGSPRHCCFANDASGHKKLVRALTKNGASARVCLEATGVYSLEVSLALDRAARIEVMVANPRAVSSFAKAYLKRSKTDALDAEVLVEFARRMPFTPWRAPAAPVLEIRAISRRIAALTKVRTQERARLHAATRAGQSSQLVCEDIQAHIEHLEHRITELGRQAVERIRTYAPMRERFELLISIKGIAETSAVRLVAELAVLPEDMTVRQWVAHAGLDPRTFQSGTSVHKRARISKAGNRYLRAALYMPALVAIQYEPRVRAFYDELVARGKTKLQAIVAVMRKLLHAIYGMSKSGERFDPERFYRAAA